jgi:nitrate reductase beta subunit
MPKVRNWQLGRDMDYPYEDHRPRRQWSIVFDLNKCIGCQTCSLACKTTWTSGKGQEYMFWNNVECKPWGSYPMGWDVNLLQALGQEEWLKNRPYDGKTIFESAEPGERAKHFFPQDDDWANPNHGEDDCNQILTTPGEHLQDQHQRWFFYLPRTCAHCTYPACLAACPRKAIYKRPEDGIVVIDQSRCKGYQECVRACPYKRSMYNPYTRVSEKCIGCYPAVEQGEMPMCVQNCIGKIRLMGFISPPWEARAENPVDFLVHTKKIALPLYPQFGLEPNIYFIPPIHADRNYLEQMFGPHVDDAIANYRALRQDPVAAGLLVLIGSTNKILHAFKVADGHAYGYDEQGFEVAKVPLVEPLVERAPWDSNLNVVRHNSP